MSYITIKGTKDGLTFLFDEQCAFEHLLSELQEKVDHSHLMLLDGPAVHVHLKFGSRVIADHEIAEITKHFERKSNVTIASIQVAPSVKVIADQKMGLTVDQGMVRSGQVYQCEGDLLYLGDVNPGGRIEATGSIYVMGSLKGIAVAGIAGDDQAIIAASQMKPTQLRIANVISRPPDEWLSGDAGMEFAAVEDGVMMIHKMPLLAKMRPGLGATQFHRAYSN